MKTNKSTYPYLLLKYHIDNGSHRNANKNMIAATNSFTSPTITVPSKLEVTNCWMTLTLVAGSSIILAALAKLAPLVELFSSYLWSH